MNGFLRELRPMLEQRGLRINLTPIIVEAIDTLEEVFMLYQVKVALLNN